MKSTILILLSGVMVTIGMSSFSFNYDPQEYIVLTHTDSDGTRDIAILKSNMVLVDCHKRAGDTEVPYDEKHYLEIIGGQHEGADICNH